jgi:4-amino-4-deoxy-L-arabinose transferase-like glycosyltransferase
LGVPLGAAAVVVLLALGLGLRLPGIATPSVEQRENQSSLLARGWYHGNGDDLAAWQHDVLDVQREVVRPFEPPALELVAAAAFRVLGEEAIWFPRLVSALAWLAGGAFLALLANRITNRAGMLTAVALYLVWPSAAWHSRKFMPDALLVSAILAAALTIVRYWERPTRARFLVAAGTAAVAGAIANGRLREEARSGRLPLFVGLAASVTATYVAIGHYLTDFVDPDAGSAR